MKKFKGLIIPPLEYGVCENKIKKQYAKKPFNICAAVSFDCSIVDCPECLFAGIDSEILKEWILDVNCKR